MFGQRISERLLDEYVYALKVIEVEHHEVHEGHMFVASYKTPDGGEIADNANITLHVQTGSRTCHAIFSFSCGGDAEIELYEAPTSISGNGTSLDRINLNRNNSTFVPSAQVWHTPTASGGLRLLDVFLPGGVGGNFSSGGAMRDHTEWNLRRDTHYLARVTNRSGGAQPASILFQWYEEG